MLKKTIHALDVGALINSASSVSLVN